MIWGFSIFAWITIVTVVVTVGILLYTKLRADLVFLGVIGVLFVTGVLDVNEALSGLSSTTVAVVGVMFVVVAGLTYTGVHRVDAYAKSFFTISEMTRPSAFPANCLLAVPITLPISFMLVAPTSAIIFFTSASISSWESCFGR